MPRAPTQTTQSASKPKKTRGHQSGFSGPQQAFLDGLAKDFMNRKDCGAFYDKAVQGLIVKFGYTRDGKEYVEAEKLTSEKKSEYYQALRGVSSHFLF